MLNPSDFVHIPYTPELNLAGILYACRSLALGELQASNLHLNPVLELSAEIAAEIALRRYLAGEHISFKTLEAEPFTHPERSEIILGGRSCHVINTSIAQRQHLRRIQANPAALLSMPACASEAALISEKWGYRDLLVFTFTLGETKPARLLPGNVQAEWGQDYLIYIFPEAWRKARLGVTTPGLTLQNAGDNEISVEIGGLATNRGHVTQAIRLLPRRSVVVAEDFTNLVYLSTQQALTTTISAHHPTRDRTLHISPDLWRNLRLDCADILLAGYIEAGEFHRYAHHSHASARLRASGHSLTQTLSLPVQDLHPLPQLITWLQAKQNSH